MKNLKNTSIILMPLLIIVYILFGAITEKFEPGILNLGIKVNFLLFSIQGILGYIIIFISFYYSIRFNDLYKNYNGIKSLCTSESKHIPIVIESPRNEPTAIIELNRIYMERLNNLILNLSTNIRDKEELLPLMEDFRKALIEHSFKVDKDSSYKTKYEKLKKYLDESSPLMWIIKNL